MLVFDLGNEGGRKCVVKIKSKSHIYVLTGLICSTPLGVNQTVSGARHLERRTPDQYSCVIYNGFTFPKERSCRVYGVQAPCLQP